MTAVGIVVEGLNDRTAADRLLAAAGHQVDPVRVVVKRGKTQLDPVLASINRAAVHLPWLVLRDADLDADDCPVALRRQLLSGEQAPLLSVRLVVRSLEAWVLADRRAFALHFGVQPALVPADPEQEQHPKRSLVAACSRSRQRSVRQGMARANGTPGPEYTAMLDDFLRRTWDPARARQAAPSLSRAWSDIEARFGQPSRVR